MAHDHASPHAHHDHKADAKAAFSGLIGGAIVILILMYGIVLLTNKKFEGHSAATPSATTPGAKTAPGAPH